MKICAAVRFTREIVGKSSIDLNFDKKEEISLKSLLSLNVCILN